MCRAIITALLFIFENAVVLVMLLVIAGATGTAVMGPRAPLAMRLALGMAVAGQLFVLLGTFGALRPWTLGAFAAIAIAAATLRMSMTAIRWKLLVAAAIAATPLFLLALYPPVAFDETLYHLPFVKAMAGSGAIRFLPGLRFPAFPQIHELLCVPAFLLSGDTATHLVALAEVITLAGLLIEWPDQRMAGSLAAALVLGNPIVIQMATVTHTEAALMLFVAAGFYCLDRNTAAAGFLLGTACSVKYLGWYFAAAAVVYLLLFGTNRRRMMPLFFGAFAVATLPMYARIAALTGNPVFPFMPKVFGSSPWTIPLPDASAPGTRIVNALRVFWDVTFAREHLNMQPPYSPLFAVAMLITLIAAVRGRRAAFLCALCAGYIAIFTFLPQDSRYLLPLMPLVSIAAAIAVTPLLQRKHLIALTLLAIAPGVAYTGYRLARQWPPPVNAAQREQYLEAHIPEYRALERRGSGRIYVCGAEQLKYFGGDDLLGEVGGPLGNQTIIGDSRDTEQLWLTLTNLRVSYLLVSRAHCPIAWKHLPAEPRFELVYMDAGATLWRVRPRAERLAARHLVMADR